MYETSPRERLKQAAQERWDENWTLRTREWATGDKQHMVFHSRGRVADGDLRERDQIVLGPDDEFIVERVRFDPVEFVDRELLEKYHENPE
jgi:hypothetical protein